MSDSKTFKIYTLGCKVNQYDSRDLKGRLLSHGLAGRDKNNDLVIVNTCAVTGNAIRKDKRAINKLTRDNPGAKLVILGCWPRVYKQEVEKLEPDLIWGTGHIRELSEKILDLLEIKKNPHQPEKPLISEDRSRYFIKIQDGCEQFCSYCIIPYTRGKLRSRSIPEIKTEIKQAVDQGFKEIILTGIHLGLYGVDKRGGRRLVDLLKELIPIRGLGRIRLSSIEVTEVSEDLIELIQSSDKICPHLHIPLQSGSDKILKSMNRPYTTSFFKDKIRAIRSRIPDIALTTDIMVGFPGEGEREFGEIVDFVKRINFSRLHVFPFFAHEGTPAAELKGRVATAKIRERTSFLRNLSSDLEKNFQNKFQGQKVHPVVEHTDSDKGKGRTEYYFKVSWSWGDRDRGQARIGQILELRL